MTLTGIRLQKGKMMTALTRTDTILIRATWEPTAAGASVRELSVRSWFASSVIFDMAANVGRWCRYGGNKWSLYEFNQFGQFGQFGQLLCRSGQITVYRGSKERQREEILAVDVEGRNSKPSTSIDYFGPFPF